MKIKSGRLSPISAPLVGEVSVIWLNSLEFTLKFYFAVHLSEQQINDLSNLYLAGSLQLNQTQLSIVHKP